MRLLTQVKDASHWSYRDLTTTQRGWREAGRRPRYGVGYWIQPIGGGFAVWEIGSAPAFQPNGKQLGAAWEKCFVGAFQTEQEATAIVEVLRSQGG